MSIVNLVALHLVVSHERHKGHIRFLFKWKFLASISSSPSFTFWNRDRSRSKGWNDERRIIPIFHIVCVRLWLRSLQRDNTFYYLCNYVNDLF